LDEVAVSAHNGMMVIRVQGDPSSDHVIALCSLRVQNGDVRLFLQECDEVVICFE